MRISPRSIGFTLFVGIGLMLGLISQFPDNKLHIVFCDVGQGDAIYIRTPSHQDVLVDGGPSSKKLLRCLSEHMPFYDRTIDIVAITHPQHDHYGGILEVLNRYKVNHFVGTPINNDTKGYSKLKQTISNHAISIVNPYTGSSMQLGDVVFKTLWPDRHWFSSMIDSSSFANLPAGKAGTLNDKQLSDNVLGAFDTSQDLNDFSIYFHIQMGEFDVLLTGDGDVMVQNDIMNIVKLPEVEVLKVPHHGSKTGMTEEFLNEVKPELSVISVGKNSYGHPSKSILEMLEKIGSKILRTDKMGDVEIVSDGENWWVVE